MIALDASTPIEEMDDLEFETLLTVQGFMILDPKVDEDAAFDLVYAYLKKATEEPGYHSPDNYLTMVMKVKEAKPGSKVVH